MSIILPQAVPYQGSKRKLVNDILEYFPRTGVDVLWEPFCGSGAISVNALNRGLVKQVRMSDKLEPLINLWNAIISEPEKISKQYQTIWNRQFDEDGTRLFNDIREKYNQDNDPAKLLYLICRCVKNAVRFNDKGEFNQSPDKRRLGKNPEKLRKEIATYSVLLKNKSVVTSDDYYDLLDCFSETDLVYMDPPYQGTSMKKDQRYAFQLDFQKFVASLNYLNKRKIRYLVSFDGRLGEKTYGEELSNYVDLTKKEIVVGRSSQSTLLGKDEVTVESLYLSPALTK